MHDPPLASATSRSPAERPRSIPRHVKAMILTMIYDGLDFVTAGKANGIKPDHARRWLHRPEVVALLRRERAAFRTALCAANERVLADIRDTSENAMARVHSIKTLEGLDAETVARQPGAVSAGITIKIVQAAARPELVDVTPAPVVDVIPVPRAIDHAPAAGRDRHGRKVDAEGYPLDEHGNRVFDPRRSW